MSFPFTEKAAYYQHIQKVIARGPYHDCWDSLTDFTMPGWYEKAKFGGSYY